MSKRGLFVFPAAASFVNLGFARGASMHCRGLLKGRRRFCSRLCSKSLILSSTSPGAKLSGKEACVDINQCVGVHPVILH